MADPPILQNPPASTEETPPSEPMDRSLKLLFGFILAVGVVVLVIQLSMTGGGTGGDGKEGKEGKESDRNPTVGSPSSARVASSGEGSGLRAVPPGVGDPSESLETLGVRKRATALAERLGSDAASLIGIVTDLSERLDAAESELKGTRTMYTTSARKAERLELELGKARLQLKQMDRLASELAESQALLDVSQRRSKELMDKLAASPDPAVLQAARAMRDRYEAELRSTKMRLARDEAEKERLRADLAAASRELAATEDALESSELFIESIDLLPNEAKQLFLELSRLETVQRTELAKNYRLIEQKIGARVVDTVKFATGSSEIDANKAASIRGAIAGGKSDSFFLVIGYASKTGNFDLNKRLSSDRATAVATIASEMVKPKQKVKAVFLGQTDRFSGTNVLEDQICEVWEVPVKGRR